MIQLLLRPFAVYLRINAALLLLVLSGYNLFSQESVNWPPKEWRGSVYSVHTRAGWKSASVFHGVVVLKNGQVYKNCYTSCWFYYFDVLPFVKSETVRIDSDSILYIRADAPSLDKGYVEFRPYKVYMYRLLKQKNGVTIYDSNPSLNLSDLGSQMLLFLSESKPVVIYNTIFRKDKMKLILRFINKRYNQSFKKSDFKTGLDMIDYILTQEGKK